MRTGGTCMRAGPWVHSRTCRSGFSSLVSHHGFPELKMGILCTPSSYWISMRSSGTHRRFTSGVFGTVLILVLILLVSGCTQQAGTPAGTTTLPATETVNNGQAPGGMGLLARPATAVQTFAQRTMVKPAMSLRTACGSTEALCGGSCIDVAGDPDNCGGCGKVCSAYPHTNRTCSGGACGSACLKDFEDCNKNTADGCEASLASDKNNCGRCGNVCDAGLTCFIYGCQKPLVSGGGSETISPPAGSKL